MVVPSRTLIQEGGIVGERRLMGRQEFPSSIESGRPYVLRETYFPLKYFREAIKMKSLLYTKKTRGDVAQSVRAWDS